MRGWKRGRCSECGRFADVNEDRLCRSCFDDGRGQSTLLDAPLSDPRANREGAHHHDAGETERAAALGVEPRSGTLRWRALRAIHDAGHVGLTDHELAEQLEVWLYSIAPRRTELAHDGWVEDSGARRPTPNGADAIVWVVTDGGRARLAAGRQ